MWRGSQTIVYRSGPDLSRSFGKMNLNLIRALTIKKIQIFSNQIYPVTRKLSDFIYNVQAPFFHP